MYLDSILKEDSHTVPVTAGQETGDKSGEQGGGETGQESDG